MGGQLNAEDAFRPDCIVKLPGTNMLQVFYRGQDNHLWTLWRKTDGTWEAEQDLGGLLNSDPSAAQLPGTNILEVFYQGARTKPYIPVGGTTERGPVRQTGGTTLCVDLYRCN